MSRPQIGTYYIIYKKALKIKCGYEGLKNIWIPNFFFQDE